MTLTIGTIGKVLFVAGLTVVFYLSLATMNEVSRMRGDITSFMDSAKVSKESVSSQLVNLKNRLDSEALGETISSAIEDALDEFKSEQNEELSRRIPDKLKEVISKLNTMYDEYTSSKESIADAIDISQDIENRLDKLAENIMNTNTELEATQLTLEDIKASLRQVELKTPAAKKEPKKQLDGGRDEEHDSNVEEKQDKEELELTSFTKELLSAASKDQIHIVAVLPTSQCTTTKCKEVLDKMTSISKLLQATETRATFGKVVLSNPGEFLGVKLSGIPTIIATARHTTHEFPASANAEIIKAMYIDSLIDALQGDEQEEHEVEHDQEHEHEEEDEHEHEHEHNRQKAMEQRDEEDKEDVEDVEDVVEQEQEEQDLEADKQDESIEDENDM